MKKNEGAHTGFTLIELLVVIAIIGIVSVVASISISSMRSKARDSRRMSDIKQITTALELYYDTNGSYPSCPSNYVCDSNPIDWDGCLGAELSMFINKLPKDPGEGKIYGEFGRVQQGYCYNRHHRPSGDQMTLSYFLENANHSVGNAILRWVSSYNGVHGYEVVIQPYAADLAPDGFFY